MELGRGKNPTGRNLLCWVIEFGAFCTYTHSLLASLSKYAMKIKKTIEYLPRMFLAYMGVFFINVRYGKLTCHILILISVGQNGQLF